ncbi:MAG: aminomethyl-transferring glycine dehydrogenase, partial [Ignavibacteriaceae bacterium]
AKSVDDLIDQTIPSNIKLKELLTLTPPLSEHIFLEDLKKIAQKNKVYKSYIGMGYYPAILPTVIQRNILENPGWYTQYTPYQAEIAQGRLEALLNFQTVVSDLTAMEIANASLLDEGTAAGDAMSMFYSLRPKEKKNANVFFVSEEVFPQTLDVLKTRANPLGIELRIGDAQNAELSDDVFGLLVQYPAGNGEVRDYTSFFRQATEKKIFKVVAADLLSLTLLKPPGEFGADAVVGNSQRFGIPMGFGGPHAAYFATKEEYKRSIPGRIIGVSVDADGNRALRMALQTREQHIKRERATSNICTAQVLLAVMAGMYAVYHGAEGLKSIAFRIRKFARILDLALSQFGFKQLNKHYFDTLLIETEKIAIEKIKTEALKRSVNFRYIDDIHIGISVSETTEERDIKDLLEIFAKVSGKSVDDKLISELFTKAGNKFEEFLPRTSDYLTYPVFKMYRTETELLRYMKRLENKDLSLAHSMIPLGSCTMKLNATTEMIALTWDEFAHIHPFAPADQTEGYLEMFKELEKDLAEITGFDAVSLQPNSGAQGEYTGLMVIRAYQKDRGEANRNIVLIPSSAHGTNPASAVMAGMKVVVVKCDDHGNIDVDDLRLKAQTNKENLSALMITYPSTHGVFEESVIEICKIIHDCGGQVYMDGANLNAQLGLTNPGIIGADVCHLNLHKTFCIPHGGGGPGAGPIAVNKHLTPYLPGHSVISIGGDKSINAVSSAPWGSSLITIISYAYIKMMGGEGLTEASKAAIVNANYMMARLKNSYKVLYSGLNGRVGHELIFDMRGFKHSCNIEVEDIAKRLMDYGFHAPTVSFPVPGTLMIEPTESESKAELDRYCEALLSIREEIKEIEEGKYNSEDNVLKNSPHTLTSVISDEWKYPYSREKAAYPLPFTREGKFWPCVRRVDNAYGDRNLVCSCLPIADYLEETVNQ